MVNRFSCFLLLDILAVVILYGPAKYAGQTQNRYYEIIVAVDKYV